MKFFFSLVLFLSLTGELVYPQNFAPVGARWIYNAQDMFIAGMNYPVIFQSVSDTTVNGKNCRKILAAGCSDDQLALVYDSNNIVYRFNSLLNRFTVLYNFNANAGDSWIVISNFHANDSVTVHIDSTAFININGQSRKILYGFAMPTGILEFSGPFVAGIGSFQNFLPQLGVCDPLTNGLRCYEDASIGSYQTGIAPVCDTVFFTRVNEVAQKDLKVNIEPNPFSDFTRISFPNYKFENTRLIVRDLSGRELRRSENISGNEIIFLRDKLTSGIYLYELNSENYFSQGKLIIN